ncbi:hypothetical protein LIER_42369 [Lithospermum erythrorhizon]|uniref:Uncharacterized protein n=1 Tax=Lithospermum erythrorhizon TaxID=34254 RepID=A0AAV3RSA3_LITER
MAFTSFIEFREKFSSSSVQKKILHLKGSGRESPDPPSGFHFLGSTISSSHMQWRGPLKIHGNFDYIHVTRNGLKMSLTVVVPCLPVLF